MSDLLLFDQVADLLVQVLLDDRLVLFLLVVQHFRVLEVLDQARDALQSRVGQVTNLDKRKWYLFGLEPAPSLAVEHFVKPPDGF